MKNINSNGQYFRFGLILSLFFTLSLFPQTETLHKKDVIKLSSDKHFGANTDWETLFYDLYKSIVAAPDGSIFVSNAHQHFIYKFSPTGELIKKFGSKGEGPGDLRSPHRLSILDGKYLVVEEYALARRVSLFNLDTTFFKLIRTKNSAYSPWALKNNCISYTSRSHPDEQQTVVKIWIKNILTDKEILVKSFNESNSNQFNMKSGITIGFNREDGHTVTTCTRDGNLIVGFSNSKTIEIFSPEGKRLKSFQLDLEPLPVTPKYIKEFKQQIIEDFSTDNGLKPFVKELSNMSFSNSFNPFLPFYRNIYVDSTGNIWILKWEDCVNNCRKNFQVYSPEGKRLKEIQLIEDEYEVDTNFNCHYLIFEKDYIIAFAKDKNDEDNSPRLIKTNLN